MAIAFILLFLTVCFATQMKVYSVGEYTISPIDYNYALNIVVELWGAGGSVYNQSAGPHDTCAGSGSYIKASVPTYLSSFKLKVGKAINENTACDGENTYFTSKYINLTVGGGYGRCGDCKATMTCGYGGNISVIDGIDEALYLPGEDSQYIGDNGCCMRACTGGDAPNGGKGGSALGGNLGCGKSNGTLPGGGAGWYVSNCSAFGWGGDGTAIVYF
jgi:hypothetical protein